MDNKTDLVIEDYECNDCGSIYTLKYDQTEIQLNYAADYPNVCPFCGGDVLNTMGAEIDDDFGLGMTDHVSFGKGVDHMDSTDSNDDPVSDYD
jgi:hypothetical protein